MDKHSEGQYGILMAFAIKDLRADCFPFTPFFAKNSHEATRIVARSVNDPQTQIAHYPSDYAIFLIGSFAPGNGKLTMMEPAQLVICDELVRKVDNSVPFNGGKKGD